MITRSSCYIIRSRAAPCLWALALLVVWTGSAAGQGYGFEEHAGPGVEIGRWGTAIVIESPGPALFGEKEFYRPVPPLQLKSRWIVVQDSTFGLVFAAPSGVKSDAESYVGDVSLRSLVGVSAVEVRTLVLNVWGEFAGYLAVTTLTERSANEAWVAHPRWTDLPGPAHEYRTSIMWINRVMFDDESILEADMAPIAAAWKHVTGSDFEGMAEDSLLRAVSR